MFRSEKKGLPILDLMDSSGELGKDDSMTVTSSKGTAQKAVEFGPMVLGIPVVILPIILTGLWTRG